MFPSLAIDFLIWIDWGKRKTNIWTPNAMEVSNKSRYINHSSGTCRKCRRAVLGDVGCFIASSFFQASFYVDWDPWSSKSYIWVDAIAIICLWIPCFQPMTEAENYIHSSRSNHAWNKVDNWCAEDDKKSTRVSLSLWISLTCCKKKRQGSVNMGYKRNNYKKEEINMWSYELPASCIVLFHPRWSLARWYSSFSLQWWY